MRIIEEAKPESKKIFTNSRNKPLKSKLVKVTTIDDEKLFHYDVYLEINKRQAILQNLKKIEINLISDESSQNRKRPNLFDNVDTNNTNELNLVAINAARISFDQVANINSNNEIYGVGEMSSDNVFINENLGKIASNMLTNKPDKETFGFKSRLALKEQRNTGRPNLKFKDYLTQPTVSQNNETIERDKFNSSYVRLVNSGIDPATMLSKAFGTNTSRGTLSKFRGSFASFVSSPQSGAKQKLYNSLTSGIETTINTETSSVDYVLELETLANIEAKLSQRIVLSESLLQNYPTDEISILFIARNDKNVKIESGTGIIEHIKEEEKINFPKFDFEVEANRTTSGQSILSIKNNEALPRLFNVYSRQLNNYLPQELIPFEAKRLGILVQPRQKITLFRKGNFFKKNRPVFFRVNPVYAEKEYSNSKFASITTGRRLSNLTYAGISAIIQNDRIAIQVKNVSPAIKKIELHRKNLTRKERKFSPTQSKGVLGNSNELTRNRFKSTLSNDFSTIYKFVDDDVEEFNTYEYKAVLYDENGNKYMSSSSAIERYTKPTGYVNMTATQSGTGTSLSEYRQITIAGNVERKETDADRLFKDLFGRYYDLFEDDLKEIKDLTGMSINVLVEMINRDNSEITSLGNMSTDSEGNFSKEFLIPKKQSLAIKLTPRVLPPSDLLSKLTKNLENLALQQRFAPVSPSANAALKTRLRKRSRGVVSATGDKFSSRMSRTKGKIIDSRTDLSRTDFDSYYDGDTGDVFYLLVEGQSSFNLANLVNITNSSIEYLELDNTDQANDNNQKRVSIKEEFYLSNFNLNNESDKLDFLLMSFEENGNLNFSGLAYASNNTSQVNYVYKTPLLYGKISFFASPVLKNGETLAPILIKTIYKDDQGIK